MPTQGCCLIYSLTYRMTPDILGSNPIFYLSSLAVSKPLQCQESEAQVCGEMMLNQGMIYHLSMIAVLGNFALLSPYSAMFQ